MNNDIVKESSNDNKNNNRKVTKTTIHKYDILGSNQQQQEQQEQKLIIKQQQEYIRMSIQRFNQFRRMTKGNKKNKHIQILKDVKLHNYWDNIFRRKSKMHDHFSESAFGSNSDKLIKLHNLWEDPEYLKKYSKNKNNKNN